MEDGRAAGVEATVTHADGATTSLSVEAPCVVAACGSVESPALLCAAASGPAVGKHLRVHPAYVVMGVYEDSIEGWRGQVQSARVGPPRGHRGGLRLPVRGTALHPGFFAGAFPGRTAPSTSG